MSRQATIGLVAILLVTTITGFGCDRKYATPDNATETRETNVIEKTVQIQPAKTLREVASMLGPDMKIQKMTILEEEDRELDFQLAPTSNDADEILAQYETVYTNNYGLLRDLLSSGSPTSNDAALALDREVDQLTELMETPRTLDSVMVSVVEVEGPKTQIEVFKEMLKQADDPLFAPRQIIETIPSQAPEEETRTDEESQSEEPFSFAQFTPEEMAEVFRLQLEYYQETYPNEDVIVQITFRDTIPLHQIKEQFSRNNILPQQIAYHSDSTGSGFTNIPHDSDPYEYLTSIYERSLLSDEGLIQTLSDFCGEPKFKEECDEAERMSQRLEVRRSLGELYIFSIGAHGKPINFLALWDSMPEVFVIEVEPDGVVFGRPLTPNMDMSKWF